MHTDKELRLWEQITQSKYRMGRLRPRHIALAEKSGIVWRDAGANFMPFIEARSLARAQHLTGENGFRNWDRPEGMPSQPDSKYKDSGWVNWGEFLGTGNVHSKTFLSFTKARMLVCTFPVP